MSASTKWLSVVGARPQFIKLAPLCRAIESYNRDARSVEIVHSIVHTGQHYDREMADLLFEQLSIPQPNYNLAVGSSAFGTQLGQMLAALEPVLVAERPDQVIVYGDTNSTLAGALVAARLGIPVAHVEAGCRSYRPQMPEEQNRVATDHLSKLLLAPSRQAVANLTREGIGTADDPLRRKVSFVGDLMFDALIANAAIAARRTEALLAQYKLEPKSFYLLTLHRAENTDNLDNLRAILDALSAADYPVLFPIHPRTAKLLTDNRLSVGESMLPIPPLGYMEMLSAQMNARKVLTDSGGVQKEAFYLKVPCITLRDETEWPETVGLGANELVGANTDAIKASLRKSGKPLYFREYPFGDGHASEKIVEEILKHRIPTSTSVTVAKSA